MKKNVIIVSCMLAVVVAIGMITALSQMIRNSQKTTISPTPTPFGGVAQVSEELTTTPEATATQTPTKVVEKTPTPTEATPTTDATTETNAPTETGTTTEENTETTEPTPTPEDAAPTPVVATPTPTTAQTSSNPAIAVLERCSADELGLDDKLSAYDIDVDDWTSIVEGIDCYGVNVLYKDGGLAGIFFVSSDYTRAFRAVDDDEYVELNVN